MSDYFRFLPQTAYFYGDENTPVATNDLTVYIDLIDQLKKSIEYYSLYYIQEDERPDVLSHKLYGTTAYHWTFFLLNDKLKEGGWPLSTNKIYEETRKKYNRVVITTEEPIANNFKVGTIIKGQVSHLQGTVVDRRLDYGQLIIETTVNENDEHTLFSINTLTENNEILLKMEYNDTTGQLEQTEISIVEYEQVLQYNSVRSYIDPATNEEVFPTITLFEPEDNDELQTYTFNKSSMDTMTPLTQLAYYTNENDKLRSISVLTRETVVQVVNEFKRLANEQ